MSGAALEDVEELRRQLGGLSTATIPSWEALAGKADGFRQGLRAAVAGATDAAQGPQVRQALEEAWGSLTKAEAPVWVARYYRETYPGVPIDTDRLYRNACGLLATAQVAVAARQVVWDPEAPARLTRWAQEAAAALGGRRGAELPPVPLQWTEPEAPVVVTHVYDALAAVGWEVTAARSWTLRWLDDALPSPVRALKVPVAGHYRGRGFLADLRLHLLAEDSGPLVEDPDTALVPLGRDLLDALQAAWQRTRQPIGWRLTVRTSDLPPWLPLDGDSLSAAAVVGVSLLRQGRPYDREHLLVARVTEGDQLTAVGEEAAKLEAALAEGIRYAAVAPDTRLTHAQIDQFGASGMPVSRLGTLAEAEEFASGLLTELCRLLEGEVRWILEDASRRMDRRLGTWEDFDALFVPVKVARGIRPRLTEAEYEELERRRAAGDYSALDRLEARRRLDLRDERLQRELRRETVPWERIRAHLTRAVVLGDPGYGKTMLLWHEVGRRCQQGLQAIQTQGRGSAEVTLGVFVRAVELAEGLARFRGTHQLAEVLEAHLTGRHGLSAEGRRWLRGALVSGKLLLAMDALDEVPQALRGQIEAALSALVRHAPAARLLLSSRLTGYSASSIRVGVADVLEVLPLDERQMRRIIAGWFESQPAAGHALWQRIQVEERTREVLRSPLLLHLACRVTERVIAAGRGLPYWEQQRELYDAILADAVVRWSERAEPKPTREQRDLFLRFASDVASALWLRDASRTLWEPTAIVLTINDARARYRSLDLRPDLAGDLCAAGLLAVAGPDTPGTPLMWAHRAIGEYLVACALADHLKDSPKDVWEVVDRKAWDPDWSRVIVFLAGMLSDADAGHLLRLLGDEAQDDLFRHRLALAAECLGEISPAIRRARQDLVDRVTADLVHTWMKHLKRRTERVVPHLRQALSDVAQVNGRFDGTSLLEWPAQKLRSADRNERLQVLETMQAMGPAAVSHPYVLPVVTDALDDEDVFVRSKAADVLGIAGERSARHPGVISGLVHALSDRDGLVRSAAARALGSLAEIAAGSSDAIAALLRMHGGGHKDRDSALLAIRDIGNATTERNRLIPIALDALRGPGESFWRSAAVEALGEAAEAAAQHPEVIPAMLQALRDRDDNVRWRAAHALETLGGQLVFHDPRLIPALLDGLNDVNENVRGAVARALGRLGYAMEDYPAVVPVLLDALGDRSWLVRAEAAESLGRVREVAARCPGAISALIASLRDESVHVRSAGAEALGKLGPSVAQHPDLIPVLLKAVDDEKYDSHMRWRAASVLIGNQAIGQHPQVVLALLRAHLTGRAPDLSWADLQSIHVRDAILLPSLRSALGDVDDNIRIRAIRLLAEMEPDKSKVIPDLVRLLCDGNSEVRSTAVEQLSHLPDVFRQSPEVLRALIDKLQDEHGKVRHEAARALASMAEAIVGDSQVLKKVLEHLRLRSLHASTSFWAAKVLHDILESSPRSRLAQAVAQSPEKIVTVPWLRDVLAGWLLHSSDDDTRRSAARALARTTPGASGHPGLRRVALRVAGEMKEMASTDDVEVVASLMEEGLRVFARRAGRLTWRHVAPLSAVAPQRYWNFGSRKDPAFGPPPVST